MKKIALLALRLCYAIASLIIIGCLLANIITIKPEQIVLFTIPFIFLSIFLYLPKQAYTHSFAWLKAHPRTVLTTSVGLFIFSLLVRISFTALAYKPFSDPGTFLTMANRFNETGTLHTIYVGLFPYTLGYDTLLAYSLRIFGSPTVAIFALNLIFDLVSMLIIYLVARKLSLAKSLSILIAAAYFANPFCLLYAPVSLPVAAVNTFILLSLFFSLSLIEALRRRVSLLIVSLLGLATGLSLSLLATFRPVAIIFILALVIYLTLALLQKPTRQLAILSLLGLATLCIIYTVGVSLNTLLARHTTGYSVHGSSGWSLYVGANLKHSGEWNAEDKKVQLSLAKQSNDPDIIHKELRNLAIERVKSYSTTELATLAINKAIILGGKQKDSFFNLKSFTEIKENSHYQLAIKVTSFVTILTLLAATLSGLLRQRRSKDIQPQLYISILFIGLFLASLLVEVNARYFAPFIPLLVILCLYSYLYEPQSA